MKPLPHWYSYIPFILQTLLWIPVRLIFNLFLHFKVYGRKNLDSVNQVIFAINHSSEIDPFILAAALSPVGKFASAKNLFYVVAPAEEFKDTSFKWRRYIYTERFFKAWGAYAIKRRGLHNYEESLESHLHLLKQGKSICIFPEGGITKNGEPQNPKGGMIYLSQVSGIPIVPVAISGSYKMSAHTFFGRKRHVIIEFGKPTFVNKIATDVDFAKEYHKQAVNIFTPVFSMLEKHKIYRNRITNTTENIYTILRSLVGIVVRTIWIRKVTGLENIPSSGAVLIAANHESFFDFISTVAISPRNIYYLAAEKFFQSRFWRPIMRVTGQIEVDRKHKSKEQSVHINNVVYDLLQTGHAVGIFPEGTRAPTSDTLLKAYPGIIRYAFATGTPIVPIGIRGAYSVMSRFDSHPRFRKVIELHIGKPIQFPNPLTSEPSDEHIQIELRKLMLILSDLSGKKYPYED